MGKEKIVYQNWIVDLGYDPSTGPPQTDRSAVAYDNAVISAVNRMLDELEPEEANFIRWYYFQGLGYREISRKTGRAVHRLEVLHQSAILKCKARLPGLLSERYDLPHPADNACPLCLHPEAAGINQLIRSKSKDETWKRIIRTLREVYGLSIKTPQRLIGHQKYHMI